MAKKSRLTKLYQALATMRRENLQSSFELAELINKINSDIYAANPEKRPEEVDVNDPSYDELPLPVQLKWALVALHRAQRQIKEYKELEEEKRQLLSQLNEAQSKYDKLMLRYEEKCIEAKSVKSVEGQTQLRLLIDKNLHLQKEINEQRIIIKSLTNRLELQNKNSDKQGT